MKRVEFFYDLSSPYSYLASTQIEQVAARAGGEVAWRPFVLGAVFKATGNVMPATVAAKAQHMMKDLERWAAHYGVDFKMTTRFPVNAIKAMRLIVAAGRESPPRAAQATHAAFRALWVDDRDITAEDELRQIAASAGLDPARALGAIESPEVKDALRANGDEAVERGAFGAPAFFVGDELFWGNDRLHFVEAALRAK
ncbi:MAG TPA: 2-hydroxychromene-2-carboxylate isomerase [Polyangia bacterium]|nr:2-hydroxychromene-2-carboxylate isomerase [Polyangia bacterium]